MHGYVKDLKDPDSENIAAIHYKYRWIADNQCYECHSEYGLFGTAKAKMSRIRHIWSYYVLGYETPIKLRAPTITRFAFTTMVKLKIIRMLRNTRSI